MNQQTIAFDNLVCPPCVLREIARDANQLKRFTLTVTVEWLDRWLQLAMESREATDEDSLCTLLWLLVPIVYNALAEGASEEIRDWFRESLLIGLLDRFMSLERTRDFTQILVQALNAIQAADAQTESRQQLLQRLHLSNLEQLLPLTRSLMRCEHRRDNVETVQSPPRHTADTSGSPVIHQETRSPGWINVWAQNISSPTGFLRRYRPSPPTSPRKRPTNRRSDRGLRNTIRIGNVKMKIDPRQDVKIRIHPGQDGGSTVYLKHKKERHD
ncbi:hypothetical protein FRC20_009203 [Serendipita sp. 405]|nr:hypothetical protein FRC15_001651 [Serendipita sp. 397]KAG8802686.1 hypothetical protein FRC16_008955 [Serendipita sp. 398]KAG8872677.1 hypothetical protein FRC20_009203 [Serendipita sp. 405]